MTYYEKLVQLALANGLGSGEDEDHEVVFVVLVDLIREYAKLVKMDVLNVLDVLGENLV